MSSRWRTECAAQLSFGEKQLAPAPTMSARVGTVQTAMINRYGLAGCWKYRFRIGGGRSPIEGAMARLARCWVGPSPLSALLNSLEGGWCQIGRRHVRQLFGFAAPQNTAAPRVPPRPARRRFGGREWMDEYRWGQADMQLHHPARPGRAPPGAAVPFRLPTPLAPPPCRLPAAAAGWRLAGLPCNGYWSRSGGMQRVGCSAARRWRGDWSGRCCAWSPPRRCLQGLVPKRGSTLLKVQCWHRLWQPHLCCWFQSQT